MKSDINDRIEFTLDIDYIHSSKWLEDYKTKSRCLQLGFKKFGDWIEKKFDRPVLTYIYGGNISGCVAYSFLKTIELLSIKGIIDKNYPLPYLQTLDHRLPEKFNQTVELVFMAVCPTHYNNIQSVFIDQLKHKPVITYMFKNNCGPLYQPRHFSENNNNLSESNHSNIIMLGDSLTFGFDCNKLLKRSDVFSKGAEGDMTMDILGRLDDVLKLNPQIICTMIGINDFIQGSLHIDVFRMYEKIVDKILQKGAKPIIQATLFISGFYLSMVDTITINKEVGCLNSLLKKMCKSRSLVFVDLNRTIAPQGYLPSELTDDGLHLNSEGYQIWTKAIMPLLPQSKYGQENA